MAARAQEPPVILSITIPDELTGIDRVVALTEEDLRALPSESYETSTIWTTGKQSFTGVPLLALLEHYEIEATMLEMYAVNEYYVALPVEELTPDGPIIAYEHNHKPMRLRDNGPLWLIFDYDGNSEYRTELTYSRSIWQLDRMTALR